MKKAKLYINSHGNPKIRVFFDFNFDTLTKIKTIEHRKYINKDGKRFWELPYSAKTVRKLNIWGFTLDNELQKIYNKNHSILQKKQIEKTPKEYYKIKGLLGILRGYQASGVHFIEQQGGSGIIADEMGLGKTIQAIAYLVKNPKQRPAIIISPGFLKYNWLYELQKWTNYKNIQLLSSSPSNKNCLNRKNDIFIINYDIITKWKIELQSLQAKCLILDEFQYIKNDQAKRTKTTKLIGKKIPNKILLSGTPIESKPIEFFNGLNLVNPYLFPSKKEYGMRYCSGHHDGYGWNYNGASNTKELYNKINGKIMIRRLKKDVLTELPDKVFQIIPFEIDNEKEYQKIDSNFIQWVKEQYGQNKADKASNAETLTRISTLRQKAVEGKINGCIQWIEEFLKTGKKIILFSMHQFTIDIIEKHFEKYSVKLDGSMGDYKKDQAVRKFQNDPNIKIMNANIIAGGIGHTMTKAHHVAFLELPWNPSKIDQAIDRAHRYGQKFTVYAYYLLAFNTVEMQMATYIDDKRKITTSLLNGEDVDENLLITQFIRNYAKTN